MFGSFLNSIDLFLILGGIFGTYIKDETQQANIKRFILSNPIDFYPQDIRSHLPKSSETIPSSRFNLSGLKHTDIDKLLQLKTSHTVCLGCHFSTASFFRHICQSEIIVCDAGSVCINASVVNMTHAGHIPGPQNISDQTGSFPYKGCCNSSDHLCHSAIQRLYTCSNTANCARREYYEVATCSGFLCNAHGVQENAVIHSIMPPVNGNWGTWGAWSRCNCNTKTHSRSRECNNPMPALGGSNCFGVRYEQSSCADQCPVNGNWGTWGTWSLCNCNTKTHSRSRECNNPIPALGGSNCVGVRYEQSSCADQCPGTWLEWEPWSLCTATCDGGNQVRQRHCAKTDTTLDCLGSKNEMQICGTMTCPATTPVPTTTLTTTPSTTTTEGPGVWTEWTEWSTCSTSCGSGVRYIARFCIDPHTEKEKHDCIGSAVDSDSCEVLQCAVDGSWSEWNEWSGCSRGIRSRSRVCNNSVPLFNGMNCKGSNVDFTNCTETTTATHRKLVPPEIFGQTEANVGENITLICLTGISGLAVTWYYMESDHLPVEVSQPMGTNELIITGVDSKNYGKYTCVLSDSNNNTVKTQVFINLHESAPVILSLITVPDTVAEGAPVKLKCDVLAFPEPIIRWGYKDRSGNAYVPPPVTYKDGGKELDIDSFQSVLYGGTWTCNAINKLGTDHRDIVV